MSPFLGLIIAHFTEFFWKVLRKKSEPPITVFTVLNLTTSHYYNLEKSKSLLGWTPPISMDDGLLELEEAIANGGI
jgi:nucleoside-diphosphate-sugar epimerase